MITSLNSMVFNYCTDKQNIVILFLAHVVSWLFKKFLETRTTPVINYWEIAVTLEEKHLKTFVKKTVRIFPYIPFTAHKLIPINTDSMSWLGQQEGEGWLCGHPPADGSRLLSQAPVPRESGRATKLRQRVSVFLWGKIIFKIQSLSRGTVCYIHYRKS